ncbi:MAG: hypothetical protein AAB364_02305 [Patescibacteria group bacterium]
MGIYEFGSVRAQLDVGATGAPEMMHRLGIVGPNRITVCDLYHRIRMGTIKPKESWEGIQTGVFIATDL